MTLKDKLLCVLNNNKLTIINAHLFICINNYTTQTFDKKLIVLPKDYDVFEYENFLKSLDFYECTLDYDIKDIIGTIYCDKGFVINPDIEPSFMELLFNLQKSFTLNEITDLYNM